MSDATGPDEVYVGAAMQAKVRHDIARGDLKRYVRYRRWDLDQTEALLDLLEQWLPSPFDPQDETPLNEATDAALRAAGRIK